MGNLFLTFPFGHLDLRKPQFVCVPETGPGPRHVQVLVEAMFAAMIDEDVDLSFEFSGLSWGF